MNMKKAQTATEYLIILAVVIVIALVVAALLGGFPGIGASSKQNANTGYWMTTDLVVSGLNVVPLGVNSSIMIRNNLPDTITLNSINLTSGCNANISVDQSLTPGQAITKDVTCQAKTAGTSLGISISMVYTDSLNAARTFSGDRQYTTKVSN